METSLAHEQSLFEQCVQRGLMRPSVRVSSRTLAGSPRVAWMCSCLVFGPDCPQSLDQVYAGHRRMLLELLRP